MGDVIENGQHVPLAERVWDELCGLVPFELVALEVGHCDERQKRPEYGARSARAVQLPKIV